MNALPPSPLLPSEPPRNVLAALNELLRSPSHLVARARSGEGTRPEAASLRLLLGFTLLAAAYGAAAGLFQGGSQVLLAAVKAPVIVLGSLLLCLPSLYVFTSLAGADLTPRAFASTASGFAGMLGLLLSSFLPIAWLFSVGTASLLFMTWVHLLVWASSLAFAYRFLTVAVPDVKLRQPLFLWVLLFALVSLQMATTLRPVLLRPPGGPLLEGGKRLFLEQLTEVGRLDEQARRPAPGPASGTSAAEPRRDSTR